MKRRYSLPWLALGSVAVAGLAISLSQRDRETSIAPSASEVATSVTTPQATSPATAIADPIVASSSAQPALASAAQTHPTATAQRAIPGQATTRPGAAGMIVAIDPETGLLGQPNAEQIRVLTEQEDAAVNRTSDGLIETQLPDGGVVLHLDGRFQDYSVAQIGPNGKPALGCAHDHDGHLKKAPATEIRVPVLEVE